MVDGSVACWGTNEEPPEGQFTSVSAGYSTCGVRTDGSVACWGIQARGLMAKDLQRS